jgi:hypothetical protein
MKICKLSRLTNTRTWTWRTVEGNKGNYYTFANGKGILYQNDARTYGRKFCTHEKFSVCKTASGTRKKLNRLFANLEDDPSPENDYRL